MIYELEYDISSQIVPHKFVNDDYEAVSNAQVRNYMGRIKDAFEKEQKTPQKEEDFRKWLR